MTPDGRTALVTGAARGIGLAITERLMRDGCRVALLDRDAEVEVVAKRLGSSALALVADVTRTTDVDRAVQRVVDVGPSRHRRQQRRDHRPLVSDLGADRRGLAPGDRVRSHQCVPRLPGRHSRDARRRAGAHH